MNTLSTHVACRQRPTLYWTWTLRLLCVRLHERGIAVLGGDYANEVIPSQVEGNFLPVHELTIVAMGIRLFDNLDLEAVAVEAERQNRWEFMLTAAPIPVEGGAVSPMNPIATF